MSGAQLRLPGLSFSLDSSLETLGVFENHTHTCILLPPIIYSKGWRLRSYFKRRGKEAGNIYWDVLIHW